MAALRTDTRGIVRMQRASILVLPYSAAPAGKP